MVAPAHLAPRAGALRLRPVRVRVSPTTLALALTLTLAVTQEHFGYAFTVVASRKGGAVRERPPPLQQLQRSLLYLGAKYAGVLVYGEPVADEEKEHRHWLTSPLFVRGLPPQLLTLPLPLPLTLTLPYPQP